MYTNEQLKMRTNSLMMHFLNSGERGRQTFLRIALSNAILPLKHIEEFLNATGHHSQTYSDFYAFNTQYDAFNDEDW